MVPAGAPQPIAAEGAEGLELQYDVHLPGNPNTARQNWLVVLRPAGSRTAVIVLYVSKPSQFPAGIGDAKELIRRLRFSPY